MMPKKQQEAKPFPKDSKNSASPSSPDSTSSSKGLSCCDPKRNALTVTETSKINSTCCKTEVHAPVCTKIIVKFDVGFGNALYVRGQGAGLTWNKGVPLKNVKSDEWVWEADTQLGGCEFKILLNDQVYELGENRRLKGGETICYSPKFV